MDRAEKQRWINEALARGDKWLPDSIRKIKECFCGCSSPELAWAWVHDYLRRAKDYGHPKDGEGATLIAMYLMNHLGMTEHGTSVAYAWLTDAGKEAMAFLDQYGPDWESKGPWVDSEGISHGVG